MSVGRITAIVLFALCLALASLPAPVVNGTVTDDAGPVAGASVGWQGQPARVRTDAAGRFRLPIAPAAVYLTVTKPGYRIAATPGVGPQKPHLKRLPTHDNDDYAWIDPHPDPSSPNNCGNCHTEIYREWQSSAHSHAAANPKFLGLYAPDAKTWNARAEHPDGSAVCAKCHAPTLDSPSLDYDIRAAVGVAKSGIHCDYCHKISDAPTDKLGMRFGRDGLELLRPMNGDTLTFGPLDDAVRISSHRPRTRGRGETEAESFAHAPFYKESRFCASCHEGIIFGVHAYGTYSEWLDSPAKREGKQCQDCHMAPTGKLTNIAPDLGGIERDPKTLASHHTPGGTPGMLRQALKLDVQAAGRKVSVEVIAERVGHRVPTGFADRQVILLVEAFDGAGQRIELLDGPRLPKSAGNWANLPGVLYAKQLVGENQRTPAPFWLPIFKSLDTRLHPEQTDRRVFTFAEPPNRVKVQLWYRRFWQEVADARGWTDNDTLIAEREN